MSSSEAGEDKATPKVTLEMLPPSLSEPRSWHHARPGLVPKPCGWNGRGAAAAPSQEGLHLPDLHLCCHGGGVWGQPLPVGANPSPVSGARPVPLASHPGPCSVALLRPLLAVTGLCPHSGVPVGHTESH